MLVLTMEDTEGGEGSGDRKSIWEVLLLLLFAGVDATDAINEAERGTVATDADEADDAGETDGVAHAEKEVGTDGEEVEENEE